MNPLRILGSGRMILLLAAVGSAGCDIRLDGEAYVNREDKRFQTSGPTELDLTTFDGAIEITGWDKPEVLVTVERRGSSPAALESVRVEATQSGGLISVEATKATGHDAAVHIGVHVRPTVRFTAFVPRSANVIARSGGGSITAAHLHGRVELRSGDGSVTARDVEGRLVMQTGDGSVEANGVSGNADVDTGDGSIRLEGPLTEVRARTGDGSIDVRVARGAAMIEAWNITTGDGSVELALPEGFATDLDAHTSEGEIDLTSVEVTDSGEPSRTTVRGRIGAGGHPLRIRTGDGDIRVGRS